MTSIDIGMLGELDVRVAGAPVYIPRGKQQLLLAALALRPGRLVGTEELIDHVWGDDPPETARTTLRGYVKRLRATLSDAADRTVIEAASGGYRLLIDPCETDLGRFRMRRSEAAAAGGREGGPSAELCRLQSALELWRGRPLSGLDAVPWVERTTEALEEEILQAVERTADLLLEAGDPERAAARVRPLTPAHPYRESLWSRLLLALHLGGRTAEALLTYDKVRRLLADRLGVDPSASLRAVHARLLSEDVAAPSVSPATGAPADADGPAADGPAGAGVDYTDVPVASGLVGRTRELARLDELVDGGRARLVVVDGPAGVGKTALVDHWAATAAPAFAGGAVRVDLAGFAPERPLSTSAALTTLLVTCGWSPLELPADPAALAALWRRRTSETGTLVVLDNARDAAHVRPLLPGDASVAVVTSQDRLCGLVAREGAARVSVPPLGARDAARLVAALTTGGTGEQSERADETEAVHELVDLCEGLPLALRIAAEELGRVPDASTAHLVGMLGAERTRLAQLETGDEATGMRAVLSRAHARLTPEESDLLRLLAVAGKLEFDVDDVAGLLGRARPAARALMRGLVAVNVVAEPAPGRYRLGDLQRLAAAEL